MNQLNPTQLKDFYDTIVHESIHADLPFWKEPNPHEEGDAVYEGAKERRDQLWNDKDKREELLQCQ